MKTPKAGDIDVDMLEVISLLLEVIEAQQVVEALPEATEELKFLGELLGVQRIEGHEFGRDTEPPGVLNADA